jgi:predicted branched-subunit amino acid permease
MASSTPKSVYWQGVRDGAPFVLVVSPFALLFGVVATEAGLNVFETLAFSIVVIAGAAQFTALQLMSDHVPTAIVLISALAVNLRMAMYSASLTPFIGGAPLWQRAAAAYLTVDQSYACSISAYEQNPEWTVPQRMRYFFGAVTPVVPMWYVMTLVGALIGTAIPKEAALDFAVPITFIALIAPMLRTMAHLVAALASVTLALVFAFLPFNLGLLVAGIGGMMAGAQTELIATRRAAPEGVK